jgi:hypothetical protein
VAISVDRMWFDRDEEVVAVVRCAELDRALDRHSAAMATADQRVVAKILRQCHAHQDHDE